MDDVRAVLRLTTKGLRKTWDERQTDRTVLKLIQGKEKELREASLKEKQVLLV